MEGYLAHKWSLTNRLPANHPYKSAVPVTPTAVVTLSGSASDADDDPLTTTWSVVSPDNAEVAFGNTASSNTTATFSQTGTYSLRLTANDSYGGSFDECEIRVAHIPSVATWPSVAPIVEGQPLSSGTMSGGSASVDGTFSYSFPSVTPAVGIYSAAVTFTPTDTTNYDAVQGTVNVTVLTAFNGWAGAGNVFNGDANGDGVANGMAWLLGATTLGQNATALLPPATVSSGNLAMVFRCLKGTKRGAAVLQLQYSNDLGTSDPWTSHTITVPESTGTVGGVAFTIIPDPGNPDLNQVQATVPASAAGTGGKIFVRLKGEIP